MTCSERLLIGTKSLLTFDVKLHGLACLGFIKKMMFNLIEYDVTTAHSLKEQSD